MCVCVCGQIVKSEKKGRCVKTVAAIPAGAYVCEYKGDLLKYAEALEREKHYEQTAQGSYMFFFTHGARMWSVSLALPPPDVCVPDCSVCVP